MKPTIKNISIAFVGLGIISLYLGEVFPSSGPYVIPAGFLLIRAFLIVVGLEIRGRDKPGIADFWLIMAVTVSAAYLYFKFDGDFQNFMHIGLQGSNLLLIGVEQYAGVLQDEHPDSKELAIVRTELADLRKEAADLRKEIAGNSQVIATHDQSVADMRESQDKVLQSVAEKDKEIAILRNKIGRIEKLGIIWVRPKGGRVVGMNVPEFISGNYESTFFCADNHPKLKALMGVNGEMKPLIKNDV